MKSSNKSLQLSARWPFGRVLSSRGRSRCSESESGRQLNSMLSAGCIGTESALKGEEFGDVGEKFQGRMMSGLLIL